MGRAAIPRPAAEPGRRALPDATGTWIVDTNVILVANGQHEAMDPAQQLCSRWLQALMQTGRVALDAGHAVLGEYLHKTHASGGQGRGRCILRWLLHEQNNPARVDLVDLPQDASGQFRHFRQMHASKRLIHPIAKFVALSMARRAPAILAGNRFQMAGLGCGLARSWCGGAVLVPRTIAAFHDNKSPVELSQSMDSNKPMTEFFRFLTPHTLPGWPKGSRVTTRSCRPTRRRPSWPMRWWWKKNSMVPTWAFRFRRRSCCMQNRGQYLNRPYGGQFTRLDEWLATREDELFDALGSHLMLFGEWCAAQHSLDYDTLPDWFMAFDVYDRREQRFWSTVGAMNWLKSWVSRSCRVSAKV